jgi:hypothetical protein
MFKYVSIEINNVKYLARGLVRMYGNVNGVAAFWAIDLHKYIFTGEDKELDEYQFKRTGLRWTLHHEEPSGEYVTDTQALESALEWARVKKLYLARYEQTLLDDGLMSKAAVKRVVAQEAERNQSADWYKGRL